MKAEIRVDGQIYITSETAVEAFALMHIISQADKGNILAQMGFVWPLSTPVVFDNSILDIQAKDK